MAAKAVTTNTTIATNTASTTESGYKTPVEAVWKATIKGERL